MSERSPLIRIQSSDVPIHDDDGDLGDSRQPAFSKSQGIAVTICLFGLIFLSTSNISLLTTIQSSIAADLHATTQTSWFNSALLISSASLMPIAGTLCQVLTERIYLLGSVFLQAVGLIVAGFSQNVSVFLLGRVIYGSGIAALAPVALILVKRHAPERIQGFYFGLVNCAFTAGVACGAVVAGALEPLIGWRAIFWGQCPIILVLAVAVFFAIPSVPQEPPSLASETIDQPLFKKLARLDCFGMLTLISSAVLLLYSLSAPSLLITPAILALACAMLFAFVETKWALEPVIPTSVLASRGAMLTSLATVGIMSARWGVLFYIPTYGLAVQLWSAEESGFLLVPTNIGFAAGGLVVGWLHIRRTESYYIPTLVSCALFAVDMASLGLVCNTSTSRAILVVALIFNGFIMGAYLTYGLAHVLFLTEPQHQNAVIPVIMMTRGLAGAVGSSFAGGIFLRALHKALKAGFKEAGLQHKKELIQQLLARPALVRQLEGVEKSIAISSYVTGFQTLYYVCAGLCVVMFAFQAGTGYKAPREDDDNTKTSVSPDEPRV